MSGFISSVLTGILAAVAVALFAWGQRRIRDARITKQYPVAGLYASSYEDRNDGVTVTTKATAALEQRGKHVWGSTTTLDGSRTWLLDGQLSGTGRIYGTYRAEDPHDSGEGGFFLERGPNGRLDGVWAGFDSRNKTVSAGRYQFWPKRASEIRPLQRHDVPHALSILGEELGRRYISRTELETYLDHARRFALVADCSGSIAGAVTAEVAKYDDFLRSVPDDAKGQISSLLPFLEFEEVGHLKSIAVSKLHQSSGLGSDLSERTVSGLWERGATCVVTIGWTTETGCHIAGVVDGLGFQEVGAIDDFWLADSVAKDYQCPRCGQPCHCQARLFFLRRTASAQV